MGEKNGCGPLGCILPLVLALIAMGYLAYTNRVFNIDVQSKTAQEQFDENRENFQQRHP